MAEFLTAAQLLGQGEPATPAAKGAAPAAQGWMSAQDLLGQPAERSFLGDVKGFLGERAAETGAALKSVGEFAGAGIGMAAGAVAGSARALEGMARGKPRREALQEGIETSGRVGAALNPMTVATKLLGYEPDPTVIEHVMEKMAKAIHHYGEKVEVGTDRAILAEDVDLFSQLLMGAGMGKATVKGIEAGTKAATAPAKPGISMEDMAPPKPAEPAADAPVQSVGELLVMEKSKQVKELFKKAKAKGAPMPLDVTPEALENLFNQAREGTLPAREAPKTPLTPEQAVEQSKTRIAEGLTLSEARAKLDAESAPPTDLALAIEKVRGGRAFDLTAEEKISLDNSLKVKSGVLLDHNGRAFERGSVDPDLLKGILAAGGVAAYVAMNPERAEEVAWLSGGALAIKGKGPVTAADVFKKANPAFEKSHVSSADGTLIPVYHGGKALESGMPSQGYGLYGEGVYLTGRPVRANGYATREGSAVYPAYVNLKNPISSDLFMERFGRGIKTKAEATKITEQLKAEGFDGVLDKRGDYVWEAVAFEPETQLKSALSGVTKKEQTLAKDAILEERMKEQTEQRGSADPELLAKVAAGVAAGAYLAQNPDSTLGVAALGLGLTMKGKPEAALLESLRKGGKEAELAATELYTRTHKQVERTLRAQPWAKHVSIEEAVNDGMYSAIKSVADGSFRGESKFSTYATTAVLNRGKNQVRDSLDQMKDVSIHEKAADGSDFAETLGHQNTPEKAALTRVLGDRINEAMEKIDPKFKEAFLMIEAEGLSYAEAAERAGVPEGTMKSRVARGKEDLQSYLRDYRDGEVGATTQSLGGATGRLGKGEGGAADPRLLKALGAISGAATVGALYADDPATGAVIGGILGLGGLSLFTHPVDRALGRGTTRLAHVDPTLRRGTRDMELAAGRAVVEASEAITASLVPLKKTSPEFRAAWESAYKAADTEALTHLMRNFPEVQAGYARVRKYLQGVEEKLLEYGRFKKGVPDYIPLMVKDYKGLMNSLDLTVKEGLEARLHSARLKSLHKEKRELNEIEKAAIINNYLLQEPSTSYLPGYAKHRRLKMTPEREAFYHDYETALIHYAHEVSSDLARTAFFGKDLQTVKKGKQKFTNVESSIGTLINRAIEEGRMTSETAAEVQQVLHARFVGGEQSPAGWIQDARNVTSLLLLGQIGSGLIQASESLLSIAHHGLVPAVKSVGLLATKRGIKPSEFGLSNHIIEEVVGSRLTGRALGTLLKANMLVPLDQLGIAQNLTASFVKLKRQAETPVGRQKIADKWGPDYGPDIPRLLEELQRSTSTKRTPLVDSVLWQEISDVRPTSRIEAPELFNAHPNARLAYHLRMFMLTQSDLIRRTAWDNIKTSDPRKVAEGLKNLTTYGLAYALVGVPAYAITDWIYGRGLNLDKIDYVDNFIRNFGLSRYTLDSVATAKNPGRAIGDATSNAFTPPAVSVGKKLLEGAVEPKTLVPMVPLVGRTIYNREFGGNARQEISDRRFQPKGTQAPLSPAAKAYLREKRLQAKKEKVR